MKHIKTGIALIVIAVVMVPAFGLPQYFAALKSTYGTTGTSCGTCHVNPAGGGARNSYGKLFEADPNHSTDPATALKTIDAPPGISTGITSTNSKKTSTVSNVTPTNETPNTSTNETPIISTNETPIISTNETPIISTNETPTISTNETPTISTNETPATNETPTTPKVSTPTTKVSTPKVSTPTTNTHHHHRHHHDNDRDDEHNHKDDDGSDDED